MVGANAPTINWCSHILQGMTSCSWTEAHCLHLPYGLLPHMQGTPASPYKAGRGGVGGGGEHACGCCASTSPSCTCGNRAARLVTSRQALPSRPNAAAKHEIGTSHRAESQEPQWPGGDAAASRLDRKVQEALHRYKQAPGMSSSGRDHLSVTGGHRQVSSAGLLGKRIMDRRRALAHQQTAYAIPRLDTLGYGPPPKRPLRGASADLRGLSIRATAPTWSGTASTRHLAPPSSAEHEQEPLLPPGLAMSQRIGAMH